MRWTRGSAPTSSDRPRRPFLTARWVNVALLSYPVPDEALAPLLPPGLALDRWEGEAFVSLVAFDFLDTRVGGIAWLGFAAFPEVNLRFYVREGDRRGVVFIGELVPSRVVALLARLFYNEPYRVAGIRSVTATGGAGIRVVHDFHRDGHRHRITVEGRCPAQPAAEEGATHFFKEHAWGYGTDRRGRVLRYAVDHPRWRVHPGATARAEVEFGALYGQRWAFLTGRVPAHVALAEGSPVAVYRGDRLAAARPA
jgi:uncharacterized protein YqjF (DUF2071 family)